MRDGFDFRTASGRLMANVLASIAQFETEIRADRIKAGQAAARAAGKRWGGSKAGVRRKVTRNHKKLICKMKHEGESIASIARTLSLSRPTIYSVLAG